MLGGILRDYPSAKWHQYDAVARPARAGAAAQTSTIYQFDKADVVVALDADFLTCGPGSVRYSKDFAARRRRLTEENTSMNRLYAIESTPTLTGAKADHRLAGCAPPRSRASRASSRRPCPAAGGAGAVGGRRRVRRTSPGGSRRSPRISRRTRAARWSSPANSRPTRVHAAAKAINDALGNTGTTVLYGASIEAAPAAGGDLDRRTRAGHRRRTGRTAGDHGRQSGRSPRPWICASPSASPRSRSSSITRRTSTRPRRSATGTCPETHPLESWGDARSFDGTVTLMQPLIEPLYEGQSAHDFLAAFTAQPGRRGVAIVKDFWTKTYSAAPAAGRSRIRAARRSRMPTRSGARRCTMDSWPGTSVTEGAPGTALTPAQRCRTGSRHRGDSRRSRGRRSPACRAAGEHAPGATAPTRSLRHLRRRGRDRAGHGRPRNHLPSRSRDLGRPLREQRLAPGAAEAVYQGHLGPDGVDQHAARRRARPARRRPRRAALSRQHRADAGVRRARTSGAVGDGVLRLRPQPRRTGRQCRRRRRSSSTRSCCAPRTRPGSAAASSS